MSLDPENKELLNIALKASELAKKNILKYFKQNINIEWKADKTPVTKADKSTEEILRNFWEKETPDFGIIGEEFGIENSKAGHQWIVDPIDGTKSFIYGVPLFGTLIALYKKDKPLVSVVCLPALNDTLWAVSDGGVFLNGTPVKCSKTDNLQDSLVLSGTINTIESKGFGEPFKKLRQIAKLYRGWGDCYGYFLVATGRAEIMIDPVVSLWDIAPFPLLFQEAHGNFSTLDGTESLFDELGNPTHSIYEGYTGVATNGILHQDVLKIMKG